MCMCQAHMLRSGDRLQEPLRLSPIMWVQGLNASFQHGQQAPLAAEPS